MNNSDDNSRENQEDTGLVCDNIRDCPPTLDEAVAKAARVNGGELPRCTICDARGVPLREDTISNAYCHNLIRLTVEVILVNGRGEILIQQRAASCVDDPLYWDAAVGGHVDFGESPEHAARRELREETGLDIANLKHIGELLITTHRKPWGELKTYTHVYAARVSGEAEKIHEKLLQKSEVATAKWVSRAEFDELKPLEFYVLPALEFLAKTPI